MFNIIFNSSVTLKQLQEISATLEIEETTDYTKPEDESLHQIISSDSDHGHYIFEYYYDNDGHIVSIFVMVLEDN